MEKWQLKDIQEENYLEKVDLQNAMKQPTLKIKK